MLHSVKQIWTLNDQSNNTEKGDTIALPLPTRRPLLWVRGDLEEIVSTKNGSMNQRSLVPKEDQRNEWMRTCANSPA